MGAHPTCREVARVSHTGLPPKAWWPTRVTPTGTGRTTSPACRPKRQERGGSARRRGFGHSQPRGLPPGYEPKVVDAGGPLREALEERTGQDTVPQVFVKGTFIGGCTPGRPCPPPFLAWVWALACWLWGVLSPWC